MHVAHTDSDSPTLTDSTCDWLPHAPICNYLNTTLSMVGRQPNNIYQPLSSISGTSGTNLAWQIVSSWSPPCAIVPTYLWASMLHKIHESHRGREYCLRFSRDAIFWPNMSKAIKVLCHSCSTYARYGKQSTTEPMLSHPIPTTATITVINLTKAHFACQRITVRCLTDNRQQFTSTEYINTLPTHMVLNISLYPRIGLTATAKQKLL